MKKEKKVEVEKILEEFAQATFDLSGFSVEPFDNVELKEKENKYRYEKLLQDTANTLYTKSEVDRMLEEERKKNSGFTREERELISSLMKVVEGAKDDSREWVKVWNGLKDKLSNFKTKQK